MSIFSENLHKYISGHKLKLSFVSLITELPEEKLLSSDLNLDEMEQISRSLGKSVDFFLNPDFSTPEGFSFEKSPSELYTLSLPEDKQEITRNIFDLFETLDVLFFADKKISSILIEG